MPVSIQLLSSIALLKDLRAEELEKIAQHMTLSTVQKRGVIIKKNSPEKKFGFLLEGRLQGVDFTVDARSVGLYYIEPGDYFGELPIIDNEPPSEFIISSTKSIIATMNLKEAQHLIYNHPQITQHILKKLAKRMRQTINQRTLLGLPNPIQRLCALILQLPPKIQNGEYSLNPAPTHQELAIMINVSRETVTRAFQLMSHKKILMRNGNQLKILELKWLKDIAEGRENIPKVF